MPHLFMRAKDQIPQKYYMPVMSACFVCALLSSCSHEFPTKPETQEPGQIIVERTTYTTQIKVLGIRRQANNLLTTKP